jgi:1,4-alpha-glucan branching enzyme
MGEEIGARQPYRFDDFIAHREDLERERAGDGRRLFRFYQDLIGFSRRHPATRAHALDVVHALDATRVVAFTRMAGHDRLLVVASLRNQPFVDGYVIQTDASRLPDGTWRQVFNSDAVVYGGANVGNDGADIVIAGGRMQARLPASGFVVFQKL